jgi:hypothetical protein
MEKPPQLFVLLGHDKAGYSCRSCYSFVCVLLWGLRVRVQSVVSQARSVCGNLKEEALCVVP